MKYSINVTITFETEEAERDAALEHSGTIVRRLVLRPYAATAVLHVDSDGALRLDNVDGKKDRPVKFAEVEVNDIVEVP